MLNLSTKGRYATRIMIYLAQREADFPATKQEIATAEEISPHYVEQIMIKLRAAGLVMSHRGPKGGFSLARAAESVSVGDVLTATEGPINLAPCLETDCCSRIARCVTRPLWQKATDALDRTFFETTIASLALEARELEKSVALTFDI